MANTLVTLPGVDILATGEWNLSSGPATFTTEDLEAAIDAASCPAVGNPIIKLGHIDPRFDGEPAVGRVKNMTLTAGGNKITGDLSGLPAWLGDVMPSAYPQRSIEGTYGFVCQIGHTHAFVLTALALLGVSSPGVGVLNTLDDVAALYGLAASAHDPGNPWKLDLSGGPMAGTVLAAGITTEDVRRAYYDNPETTYAMWITELQLDPLQLIVADEGTSKVYRVPVTVKAGKLVFGSAVEVTVEYVDAPDVAAKRAAGTLRFASRDESRKDVAAEAPAAPLAPAALARLREIRAAVADTDQDDDVRSLIAAIDATLDEAAGLVPADTASLDPDTAQAMALIIAAESLVDELMEMLSIDDPDDRGVNAAAPRRVSAKHGTFSGSHSHPHTPYGTQGGDATHDHSHTHAGDGKHAHAHASKGENTGRGSEVDFTDEQATALRAALGLGDADWTADKVLAAAGALHEKADQKVTAGSRTLPKGVIAVEQEAWDALNRRVEAGEAFRKKQQIGERDQVIDQAVRAGKFTNARRDAWRRMWDADPEGTREVLAGLQKNVVPLDDIGVTGGSEDELMDEEYRSLFPPGTIRQA